MNYQFRILNISVKKVIKFIMFFLIILIFDRFYFLSQHKTENEIIIKVLSYILVPNNKNFMKINVLFYLYNLSIKLFVFTSYIVYEKKHFCENIIFRVNIRKNFLNKFEIITLYNFTYNLLLFTFLKILYFFPLIRLNIYLYNVIFDEVIYMLVFMVLTFIKIKRYRNIVILNLIIFILLLFLFDSFVLIIYSIWLLILYIFYLNLKYIYYKV